MGTDSDPSPVYYRLLWSDREERNVVVCMQDFDEYDYDQSKFLNNERYPTEEAAKAALEAEILRAAWRNLGPSIITEEDSKQSHSGVQYSVLVPGDRHIIGDPLWVMTGYFGLGPDRRFQKRSVTITYGDWEDI